MKIKQHDRFIYVFICPSVKICPCTCDLQRTEKYEYLLCSQEHSNWHKQQVLFNCKTVRVEVQFMKALTL